MVDVRDDGDVTDLGVVDDQNDAPGVNQNWRGVATPIGAESQDNRGIC